MILFCAGVCVCVTITTKVGRKNLANTKAKGGGVEDWQLWTDRGPGEADVMGVREGWGLEKDNETRGWLRLGERASWHLIFLFLLAIVSCCESFFRSILLYSFLVTKSSSFTQMISFNWPQVFSQHYFWFNECLAKYKQTWRNWGMGIIKNHLLHEPLVKYSTTIILWEILLLNTWLGNL